MFQLVRRMKFLWKSTHPWYILLKLGLDVLLIQVRKVFDIGEEVHGERVLRIELISVHRCNRSNSVVGAFQLNEGEAASSSNRYIVRQEVATCVWRWNSPFAFARR